MPALSSAEYSEVSEMPSEETFEEEMLTEVMARCIYEQAEAAPRVKHVPYDLSDCRQPPYAEELHVEPVMDAPTNNLTKLTRDGGFHLNLPDVIPLSQPIRELLWEGYQDDKSTAVSSADVDVVTVVGIPNKAKDWNVHPEAAKELEASSNGGPGGAGGFGSEQLSGISTNPGSSGTRGFGTSQELDGSFNTSHVGSPSFPQHGSSAVPSPAPHAFPELFNGAKRAKAHQQRNDVTCPFGKRFAAKASQALSWKS
eukprot:CAMPEP_0172708568 /NCGR_PEP_ID=MMETSP1074-20121228/51394_1 /TAXON_ID=2916 /ORGANISM="Ceratium fusus, Strain PA161109" /LENGTH=254 /DNA_ID=CAMNT_0013531569 /DNA_START=58 /DNA_END=821 /DNA_ORIENTATION=-